MTLSFTGRHLDVTAALREYTEEKLQPLQRHFERITNIHITFEVKNQQQCVAGNIQLPGTAIHAESEHNDMYTAVDDLVSKLDRQIIRYNEQLHNHHPHHKPSESLED